MEIVNGNVITHSSCSYCEQFYGYLLTMLSISAMFFMFFLNKRGWVTEEDLNKILNF